jgi:ankyrin repeat protein
VVKLLLDAGADVKAQNICGWMALHRAAEEGFEAVVKLLLDAGASVKAQSNKGDAALHLAVGCG